MPPVDEVVVPSVVAAAYKSDADGRGLASTPGTAGSGPCVHTVTSPALAAYPLPHGPPLVAESPAHTIPRPGSSGGVPRPGVAGGDACDCPTTFWAESAWAAL